MPNLEVDLFRSVLFHLSETQLHISPSFVIRTTLLKVAINAMGKVGESIRIQGAKNRRVARKKQRLNLEIHRTVQKAQYDRMEALRSKV